MSKTMKRLMILALLTVVSVGLKAQEVKVVYSDFTGGTVEATAFDGQKVVITVTPDEGYQIAQKDIEVIAVKDPASATRGDETIPLDNVLELTLVDEEGNPVVDKETGDPVADPEDLTVARHYLFEVPEGLAAWVRKADFQEVNNTVAEGQLNETVQWTLSGENGAMTLTLSGEGVAELVVTRAETKMPWDEYGEDITKLVVEEGIEKIGDGLLDALTALETITLKGSKLVALGENNLPENVTADVAGQLYNEYKADETWSKVVTIASANSVPMAGVAFGAGNTYDAFVSREPVLVPSVLLAFTVTAVDGSNVKLSEIEDRIIPANVPVLLLSKELKDDEFRTAVTEETGSAKDEGLLLAAGEDGQPVALGEVYLLYNDVFYLSMAGTIPADGVYLKLPEKKEEQKSATRSFLTLDGSDDETTSIENLTPALSKGEGAWFGLDGRRLNGQPAAKGVYIRNGQKYIVR